MSALRFLETCFEDLLVTMFADDVFQGSLTTVVGALESVIKPLGDAGLEIKFVKVLPHSAEAHGAYKVALESAGLPVPPCHPARHGYFVRAYPRKLG